MNFSPMVSPLPVSLPLFRSKAWEIAGKMKEYSPVQLIRLLKVNPDLALSTAERFASFQKDPLEIATKPAIFAYNGDAYRGLEAETMTQETLHFAQEHLRILSAMYGILRPFDAIQPYRLEMETALHINGKKNLCEFWNKTITDTLRKYLSEEGKSVLINLASQEYYSTFTHEKINARVITPVFKEYRDGTYKILSSYAKFSRGRMTRFILEHKIINPEELKLFDLDGYAFDANLSDESQWVFTR